MFATATSFFFPHFHRDFCRFCVWVFSAPSFLEKKGNFDDCYCSRFSFMGTLEFNDSVFSVSCFLSHSTECLLTKKKDFDHFVLFGFSRSKVTWCVVFYDSLVVYTWHNLISGWLVLYLLSPRNKKDNDHIFKLWILYFDRNQTLTVVGFRTFTMFRTWFWSLSILGIWLFFLIRTFIVETISSWMQRSTTTNQGVVQ